MDQIIPRLLWFDRFALDLTRGCLRAGDQDIALRPKTFEVLRHLAENAGRLVSKRELFETVWPNIAVTDDSLVQCIRELREKLGDTDHRLIRTVPRRGYLLNVADASFTERHDPPRPAEGAGIVDPGADGSVRRRLSRRSLPVWAAAIACAGIAIVYLAIQLRLSSSANDLFTEPDARRVAAIADEKQLPLPPFQISRIERDVLPEHRRFVGVWVSDTGFVNSKRQFMLVITNAESSGILTGFTVRGPPQALSLVKRPAGSSHFKARVLGDSFRYSGAESEHEVAMTAENRLEFVEAFGTGVMARVTLDPVWTLAEAERRAALRISAR